MQCSTCKTELVPVLYLDNTEVAWVCKCIVIVQVSGRGYEYGLKTWLSEDYKQGATRCPTQPK